LINALTGHLPILGFQGNINYSTYDVINTNGVAGVGNKGSIHNFSGANTYAGDIRLNATDLNLGTEPGSSLELSGKLWSSSGFPRNIGKIGLGELIISGDKDHTVPPAIANASYKNQKRNEGVTEIVEMPNRGHALVIDNGWREVADTALAFVKRFVPVGMPA